MKGENKTVANTGIDVFRPIIDVETPRRSRSNDSRGIEVPNVMPAAIRLANTAIKPRKRWLALSWLVACPSINGWGKGSP